MHGINLTGNDEDIEVAPIFPTSRSVRSKAVSRVSGPGSFRRNQMPFLPAYSYTDYKGQGRSLTTITVDLFTARGQSAYVMLSRVRTLSGLAILRPFPESKITAKLSEELSAEITRLDRLNSATYASMEGILGGTSNDIHNGPSTELYQVTTFIYGPYCGKFVIMSLSGWR